LNPIPTWTELFASVGRGVVLVFVAAGTAFGSATAVTGAGDGGNL
jgi:hypothetical protein